MILKAFSYKRLNITLCFWLLGRSIAFLSLPQNCLNLFPSFSVVAPYRICRHHSNLIIYRSLNGIWCLSPPKTYMYPIESTQAEWPSLGVGLLPKTKLVSLTDSWAAVDLCRLDFGTSLELISNDSSAFLIMKVFFILTLVGELNPYLFPLSVSCISFFVEIVRLGEAAFLIGERELVAC